MKQSPEANPAVCSYQANNELAVVARYNSSCTYTSRNTGRLFPDMATTEMGIIADELSRKVFDMARGVIHNTCLLRLRRFFKNAPVCSGMKSAK